MLLSTPPKLPRPRQRLVPGLSLCAGDEVVGRFRIVALLRADRACACFEATQTSTGASVEVQFLLATDDDVEPVHLRFLADARKAAVLQGSHVERVLHVGVSADGHPFVVREPHGGQTLCALLEQVGSLPNESAVEIAMAVCDALEDAHAHGIVHGELDPSVVHLTWSVGGPSSVKLAGLGTSRALAMLPLETRALAALAIRAPELLQQDRDVDIDGRVDVWGVGVLLYTMLAGAPPFAADAPGNVNLSVALDEPAMIAGVPDGLAEIVDACLSRDPILRPESAASLRSRLAAFSANPVFAKRPQQMVLDTGRYKAVDLDRLVKQALPSTMPPPSSRDAEPVLALVARRQQWPAPAPAPPAVGDQTPVPTVVTTQSSAPVAITLPPPRSQTLGRIAMFAAAAACLAAGAAFVGSSLGTLTTQGRGAGLVAHGAETPPPQAEGANAKPVVAQPAALPAAPAPPAAVAPPVSRTVAVSELPAKPGAHAPRARAAAAAAAARGAANAAPAAAPKPAAEPAEVAPAPAPAQPAPAVQPQPKGSDDELRRFLDDRR